MLVRNREVLKRLQSVHPGQSPVLVRNFADNSTILKENMMILCGSIAITAVIFLQFFESSELVAVAPVAL